MKPIPESAVRRVWRKMNRVSRRTGAKMADELGVEQPAIASYLLGVDEDVFNEDERAMLFFLGLVIWQIMKQGDTPLPTVSIEAIQRAEAANVDSVEKLAKSTPADAESIVRSLLVGYGQPGVLGSVLIALMEPQEPPHEPGEGVREENLGIMLLDAKTVIDVLDAKGADQAPVPAGE